jgi:hypothetical protein
VVNAAQRQESEGSVRSLLDKDFKYTPAASTDIRKTFERIRKEQKRIAEEQASKVQLLRKKA